MSPWLHALMLIWRQTSSMHIGTSTRERGHQTSGPLSVSPSCASSNFQLCAQNVTTDPSPPLNPYSSETAFSHRFQKVYTYPIKGTKFWRIGPKVQKSQEKCQNPPGWHPPNVPESYGINLRSAPRPWCGTHAAGPPWRSATTPAGSLKRSLALTTYLLSPISRTPARRLKSPAPGHGQEPSPTQLGILRECLCSTGPSIPAPWFLSSSFFFLFFFLLSFSFFSFFSFSWLQHCSTAQSRAGQLT